MVTAAALLHDLGKLEELAPVPGAEPTETGRLLGHLVLGARLAWAAADGIPDLDPARSRRSMHALLASHGKRGVGEPGAPCHRRGAGGHLADLAEARLEQVAEAMERTPDGEAWTAYLPALGTRLRTGRVGARAAPAARRAPARTAPACADRADRAGAPAPRCASSGRAAARGGSRPAGDGRRRFLRRKRPGRPAGRGSAATAEPQATHDTTDPRNGGENDVAILVATRLPFGGSWQRRAGNRTMAHGGRFRRLDGRNGGCDGGGQTPRRGPELSV